DDGVGPLRGCDGGRRRRRGRGAGASAAKVGKVRLLLVFLTEDSHFDLAWDATKASSGNGSKPHASGLRSARETLQELDLPRVVEVVGRGAADEREIREAAAGRLLAERARRQRRDDATQSTM